MRTCILLAAALCAFAQDRYTGPRPPKPDVAYLLNASTLVETEVSEAKEETRKKDNVASVAGTSSRVRTPLAEPIFLFDSQRIPADKLQMYRMDVRDGRREIVFPENPKKGQKPIRLAVKRVTGNLFRVEADEILENGEYCLSPTGAQTVFCFQIY